LFLPLASKFPAGRIRPGAGTLYLSFFPVLAFPLREVGKIIQLVGQGRVQISESQELGIGRDFVARGQVEQAQIIVGLGILGVPPERVLEGSDGVVPAAGGGLGDPQIVIGPAGLGVAFGGLLEDRFGIRKAVLFEEGQSLLVILIAQAVT